jgi:hypothetical protein
MVRQRRPTMIPSLSERVDQFFHLIDLSDMNA